MVLKMNSSEKKNTLTKYYTQMLSYIYLGNAQMSNNCAHVGSHKISPKLKENVCSQYKKLSVK